MHLKTEDLNRIEIEYDSGAIPPPYSHIFKIKINFGKNFLDSQLDLVYTDREEITEEEILNEGFTTDDDYHFQGEIPKVWEKPLRELYSKSKWSNKKLDEDGGIKILSKDSQGQIVRTVPLNQEEWLIFSQDYIQAIYEITKKEAPLSIHYLVREKESVSEIELVVRFSIRKMEVSVNGKSKEANWDETKELLSLIFLPDYDYGIATESKPNQKGHFIECGDGYWHDMQKGVFNIDDSFDAISKIKQGFQKFL
jgi:hypothetical protein